LRAPQTLVQSCAWKTLEMLCFSTGCPKGAARQSGCRPAALPAGHLNCALAGAPALLTWARAATLAARPERPERPERSPLIAGQTESGQKEQQQQRLELGRNIGALKRGAL